MKSKFFHLGDILSITAGPLVSPRHMDGVCDILNFMTQDQLFTHQLPRAARECRPVLLAQPPQLAGIDGEEVNKDNWRSWLDEQCALFGEQLLVTQAPEHAHEFIEPMSELAEKVHPDKIIAVRM